MFNHGNLSSILSLSSVCIITVLYCTKIITVLVYKSFYNIVLFMTRQIKLVVVIFSQLSGIGGLFVSTWT